MRRRKNKDDFDEDEVVGDSVKETHRVSRMFIYDDILSGVMERLVEYDKDKSAIELDVKELKETVSDSSDRIEILEYRYRNYKVFTYLLFVLAGLLIGLAIPLILEGFL